MVNLMVYELYLNFFKWKKVVAVLAVRERASVLREWGFVCLRSSDNVGELARPRELWQRDSKCKGPESQLRL